jgi:hypothetical protein
MSVDAVRTLISTAFALLSFLLGYYAGMQQMPKPCVYSEVQIGQSD